MSNVLLPFDCIAQYLEEHPLMCNSKASQRKVYDCVIEMMTEGAKKKTEWDKVKLPSKSESTYACKVCKDAKSYMLLNAKEGELVCTECGAVERCIIESNCTIYDKSVHEGSSAYATQKQDNNNIPTWLVNSLQDSDEYRQWEIEKELGHWNTPLYGSKRAVDEIPRLTLRAKQPKHAGLLERAVAALLIDDIENFFDLNDVQKRVRLCQPLEKLRYKDPDDVGEILRCLKCNARVRDRWEMRRHPCRWGKKRKRV